jgi:hypothetical protein
MKPNYFQLLANNIANGELARLVERSALLGGKSEDVSEDVVKELTRKASIVIANVKAKCEAKKVSNSYVNSGIACPLCDEKISNSAFKLPPDGFIMVAPLGSWEHRGANLTQLITPDAVQSMVNKFNEEKRDKDFIGLVVDKEHKSEDPNNSDGAMGWVTDLAARPDGLYANVKWTASGQEAIDGGSFRAVSPTWRRKDCEMTSDDSNTCVPRRLDSIGLTLNPNIKMPPITRIV